MANDQDFLSCSGLEVTDGEIPSYISDTRVRVQTTHFLSEDQKEFVDPIFSHHPNWLVAAITHQESLIEYKYNEESDCVEILYSIGDVRYWMSPGDYFIATPVVLGIPGEVMHYLDNLPSEKTFNAILKHAFGQDHHSLNKDRAQQIADVICAYLYPHDRGQWSVRYTYDQSNLQTHCFIESTDFRNDARLELTGDFYDGAQRDRYVRDLIDRLNRTRHEEAYADCTICGEGETFILYGPIRDGMYPEQRSNFIHTRCNVCGHITVPTTSLYPSTS